MFDSEEFRLATMGILICGKCSQPFEVPGECLSSAGAVQLPRHPSFAGATATAKSVRTSRLT